MVARTVPAACHDGEKGRDATGLSPTHNIPCADDFSSGHAVNHHGFFVHLKRLSHPRIQKTRRNLIDKDTGYTNNDTHSST
jgi:hypothetical protein